MNLYSNNFLHPCGKFGRPIKPHLITIPSDLDPASFKRHAAFREAELINLSAVILAKLMNGEQLRSHGVLRGLALLNLTHCRLPRLDLFIEFLHFCLDHLPERYVRWISAPYQFLGPLSPYGNCVLSRFETAGKSAFLAVAVLLNTAQQ
jgi:hypothetical protein